MSLEQFRQLPRHPAYRYEYLAGKAFLTPRGQHYHAILDLQPQQTPGGVSLRRMRDQDMPGILSLFAGAFRHTQPFGSLDDSTRGEAIRQSLDRTLSGGDGPWLREASFVAEEFQEIIGAIFITLLPDGDPCEWDSYRWDDPPPADCIERRLGRPHLTWIFVCPARTGQGAGSGLLAAASNELLTMGYRQLLSTFMIGNDSSILWHWRNGFRLLAHPGSLRRLREQRRR